MESISVLEGETTEKLEKLILDSGYNKYDTILLARRWAYELKSREGENRSIQELIPQAVRDILTTKVSRKSVRELPSIKLLRKQRATNPLENIGKSLSAPSDGGTEKEKSPEKKQK